MVHLHRRVVLAVHGVEHEETDEERPLALNVLELLQLALVVVEAGAILNKSNTIIHVSRWSEENMNVAMWLDYVNISEKPTFEKGEHRNYL